MLTEGRVGFSETCLGKAIGNINSIVYTFFIVLLNEVAVPTYR